MSPDPRLGLALKYRHAGLNDEAWQVLADVVHESDAPPEALHLAVELRLQVGDAGAAIQFCNRLLSANGADADAFFALGLAQEKAGRLKLAREAYETGVTLDPARATGWNNLGGILDQLGEPLAAIAAYEKAVALDEHMLSARNNIGVALMGQGQFTAACNAFRAVLRYDADHVSAQTNLGAALIELGHVADGLAVLKSVIALDPHNKEAWDNYLFAQHYIEDNPAQLLSLHRRWGETQPSNAPHDIAASARPSKLRIGYVSPDFRRHSVSFFAAPLITGLDRDDFEIYCYSNTALADKVTARLQQKADAWREICGQQADEVAALIKRDKIDILVDLAGHSMGHRLDVFARRAAPVQVTAIGYPGTTGLPSMDARFCDPVTDPPEADTAATEKLIRLDGGMLCYEPPHDAPTIDPRPYRQSGIVTFGSFNKLAKISVSTIELWAEILKKLPSARLLLKAKALGDAAARTALAEKFKAHGIEPARLMLQGWLPEDRDHLALYNSIDIALDTVPYNGTTTTCEALWMGVPVITLVGHSHAGRVGASLLTQAGLRDDICLTTAQYVARAVALARDAETLAAFRASLRERMAASRLCDAQAYGQAVARAYCQLWQDVRAALKEVDQR